MPLASRRRRRRAAAGRVGPLLLVLACWAGLLAAVAGAPVEGAQQVASIDAAVEPDDEPLAQERRKADGGHVARWRKHKHLHPCIGCTEGEAMDMRHMFEDCSIFTMGEHMGNHPTQTELTVDTNETVLVHLIGSKLFFPGPQSFFELVGSLMRNSTCPGRDEAARRVRNVSSLCAVSDPVTGSPVGGLRLGKQQQRGDQVGGALCVIYKVSGRGRDGADDVAEGRAAGLYGPGTYQFNFSAFQTADFPYAFWSIHYLSQADRGAAGGAAVLGANVTSNGSFVNNPPVVGKLLVNAFFVGALVVCALFFVSPKEPKTCVCMCVVIADGWCWCGRRCLITTHSHVCTIALLVQAVYNPLVGNRLLDFGAAQSPYLRRTVLAERHRGPIARPAAAGGSGSRAGAMWRPQLSRGVTQSSSRPDYVLMEEEDGSP